MGKSYWNPGNADATKTPSAVLKIRQSHLTTDENQLSSSAQSSHLKIDSLQTFNRKKQTAACFLPWRFHEKGKNCTLHFNRRRNSSGRAP